jgi:hypothetical protein
MDARIHVIMAPKPRLAQAKAAELGGSFAEHIRRLVAVGRYG